MGRSRERGAFCRLAWVGIAGSACLILANCSSSDKFARRVDPRYGVASSPRVVEPGEPIPKGGGTYRVGKPYMVAGRIYIPEEDVNYRAEGFASWYGEEFHGRLTANGEVFDMHGISAAHPTLPMPSYARVTNLSNGRSIIVRVNDRGPYQSNRLTDLSLKAARLLDFHGDGIGRVRVEYVGRAPLEGSDDNLLLASLRHNGPAPAPAGIMLASARTFLPQISPRVAARGPVPVPPDRPFTLGDGQASPEARPASDVSASARPAKLTPADLTSRYGSEALSSAVYEAPMAHSAISAYAPVRSEHPTSVMTGRGLY